MRKEDESDNQHYHHALLVGACRDKSMSQQIFERISCLCLPSPQQGKEDSGMTNEYVCGLRIYFIKQE